MTFRWQTDEDAEQPLADQPPPPDRRFQRRTLSILALLAFISLAGFLTWRTVRQRAAETEERLKADVLSMHNLARRAAEAGDEELYLSLLPRNLEGWTATQQQLLQDDLLFTGAARVYDLVPLSRAASAPEVRLDASLTQATVLSEHSFAYTTTAPLNEAITVRLAQTYSLGDTGWQVAPPPPDFWSTQVTLLGDRITVQYPRRDEAVAQRLMFRLERALSEMCALPGLDCPADLHLNVRLVPDPLALSRTISPVALLRGDVQFDLPAPSLAGQPIDSLGEALVARTYAARAIGPLISYLAGYDCCARSLLAQAIVERQLYHLGLQPWPLSADHYEALMDQGLTLGNALVLQSRDARSAPEETMRQMLSLVEFLEAALPEGELLSNMPGSLDYWLFQVGDPGQFAVQWTEFVYERSRSAQIADVLDSPPGGVVQLTCFERGAVAVLRYDLQAASWRHRLTYGPPSGWQVESVVPLPADYGDVIKETRRNDDGERVARYLWRHSGGATVLFETIPESGGPQLFAPYDGSAPHWRYTVLSPDHATLRASVEQEWWQIQLTVCNGGACQAQETIARPHWSPERSQLLLEARPETLDRAALLTYRLLRSGNRGQNAVELGYGYSPAWLDAANYAYVRTPERGDEQELVVASVGDDQPHDLATREQFVGLIDTNRPGNRALLLHRLHTSAVERGLLLVHATRPPLTNDVNPDSFLFAVRLAEDMQHVEDLQLLFHSDGGLDFRPSPDGRWIAITDSDNWFLIDLQFGDTHPLGGPGAPAWSPDGHWFVQSRDNHLMLHAPALDYKRPLVHELGDCPFSSVQWQSR